VEVAAAMTLLSIILGSVLVLMNRYAESVMDLQLTQEAFELARSNMEQLLTESKLPDMAEFGTSETNPDIEWEMLVEPFYEPITDQMWIRAICSAGFTNSKGELENIELEHWITNLTAAQVKQILAQQEVESEWMELLADGEESLIEETTIAYLKQAELDYEAYERFLERQRREKQKYISENGMDGWDEFLAELEEEENIFLNDLGMDFDEYNEFAASYVPKDKEISDIYGDLKNAGKYGRSQDRSQDRSSEPSSSELGDYDIPWDRIPPELVPLIEQLLGVTKPE
jgi:hypothetical protein